MTGTIRRPSADEAPAPSTGRPGRWTVLAALLLTVVVTVDLLSRGRLERMDLRVSEIVSDWGLRSQPGGGVGDEVVYRSVWLFTLVGGRGVILVVLAALVGWLAWRRRTLVPVARVLLALLLLTVVVYGFKYGTGRTAPAYPGSFFHRDGSSYPSGHVANAVLMWGVARWQAVEFGLDVRLQRAFRGLAVVGPGVAGVAMVALDFHWVTDAVVGAAVGIVLLGVVHGLDQVLLRRWTGARTTAQDDRPA